MAPYKDMPLADLQWLVVPAIASGQFTLAEAQHAGNGMTAPVGVVLWARVSADVDQRLSSSTAHPVRLEPKDWTSGDILWLMEAVGEKQVVNALLTRLSETQWKGKQVKVMKRSAEHSFVGPA